MTTTDELFFRGYFRGKRDDCYNTCFENLCKFCEWCFVGIEGWYLTRLISEEVSVDLVDRFVIKCIEEAKIRNTEIDKPIPIPEDKTDEGAAAVLIINALHAFRDYCSNP